MAANSIDILEPGSPTAALATQSFTRAAATVHREEVVLGNGTGDTAVAEVLNTAPSTEFGLVTRNIPSGTQVVGDGGASLTVDALDLDIRNLVPSQDAVRLGDGTDLANVTAAGELNVLATAQPGVDIGDVTVNNAAGASAVNVQDGGNSLTVDGTVSVSGTVIVDSELTTADLDTGAGNDTRAVVGLVLAASGGGLLVGSANPLPVSDNGALLSVDDGAGSLTVDGSVSLAASIPAGTNNIGDVDIASALPAGTNNIGDVDIASSVDLTVIGKAADGAAVSGNPVLIAGQDGTNVQTLKTDAAGELQVDVLTLPALVAGDNNIGNVDIVTMPGIFPEDSSHITADAGMQVFAVRKDVAGSLVSADGDYTPLQTDSGGSVRVVITGGAGSGGTSATDEAAYTPASSAGTPIMGAADETTPDAAAEGTLAIIRSTLNRALHVNLRDASGNEVSAGGGTQYDEDTASAAAEKLTMAGVVRKDTAASLVDLDGDRTELQVDANGRLHVNGSGVTQPISAASLPLPTGASTLAEQQTQTTALQKIDNIAHSGGDVALSEHVPISGQFDDAATGTVTENNVAPVRITSGRALHVAQQGELPAGTQNIGDVDVASIAAGDNNIGNVDIVTMPNVTLAAGTNTNEVVGDVAQDVAIAGNPVAVGYRASTAIPTAMSADGDAVYPWANRNGAQVVLMAPHVGLNSDPWNLVHEAAQYTTTQTSTVLVAGGASEKIVVTKVQIQAFGTTAFDLQLYFGTGAFSRGTNRAVFDGTFKPSSTLAPGAILDGPFIAGTNGDDLMVTTSAAGSVTINVWYYVVT